jgi:hypothetical protein
LRPNSFFAAFDGFSANDQPPHGQPKNNRQAECDPESEADSILAHDKGKEAQMQNASAKKMASCTNNSTWWILLWPKLLQLKFLIS